MNKSRDNGQAIIEILLFLPFLIFQSAFIFSVYGALNASINQNKITRGYLYARLKGNSHFPYSGYLKRLQDKGGARLVGNYSIGWRVKATNQHSYAPCFQLGNVSSRPEQCDDEQNGPISNFIKVRTMYAVCGNTYLLEDDNKFLPTPQAAAGIDGCSFL